MNAFLLFIQNLKKNGLEFFGLYYGSYAATVIDNDDPEKRGRLKVSCPEVWSGSTDFWIYPKGVIAGNEWGLHFMPEEGDKVWLSFRGGNAQPEYALWQYGWWLKDKAISVAKKGVFVFCSPKGHTWIIDENTDKMSFTFKDGKSIFIDKNNVNLGKDSAPSPATLGDKNADLHKDICQMILDIIQAVQSAPTVPQDGGASFKAALIASLSSVQAMANTAKNSKADATKSKVVNLE